MKIISNNNRTTYVAFNKNYTEATLSRVYGQVFKVHIPAEHFSMQKLEQFANLDYDSFTGLANIQQKRRELNANR